ncbi:MAG: agarase [Alphaproteobacteria bacterium]
MNAPNLDAFGGTPERTFDATDFVRLEQTSERWWLVDPAGNGFISIGLNHADESNLKYPHNLEIWKRKYGSRERWIRDGLVRDLKDWGFNTIGWTQEYISGDWGVALDWHTDVIDLGHSSTPWPAPDFALADMPYILQIRVAEIEDWKGQPAFPDVFDPDFDVYCEYLARNVCFDNADSRNLIGYFLVDIPSWLPHASGRFFPGFEGLSGKAYDTKLYDVASKYYETMVKHIRRYDRNHLILGDRYNGNKGIPTPVLEAMKPFVDVLSIQYFSGPNIEDHVAMRDAFAGWQEICGKPVLNADLGNWCATKLNPNRSTGLGSQAERGSNYVESITELLKAPWFVGWHWCSYVENTARGWGIKDPWDEPYQDFIGPVAAFNKRVYELAG